MWIEHLTLTQAVGPQVHRNQAELVIYGLAGVLLTLGLLGLWVKWRQRQNRRDFLALTASKGFEVVRDRSELARISDNVKDVFAEMAMYVRQLRIAGALSERRREFDLEMVHVILGMERGGGNADHQTLDKMVLFVEGFTTPLPRFSVMPNHFLFAQIHKKPVFAHSGWFGKRNLVLGTDHALTAHIISPTARQLLADNRDLVIESRGQQLAFFLHNERVQPHDLDGFIERCLDLAEEFALRREDWDESKRPIDPAMNPESMMPM